jgi:hypothetical protein
MHRLYPDQLGESSFVTAIRTRVQCDARNNTWAKTPALAMEDFEISPILDRFESPCNVMQANNTIENSSYMTEL